MKLELLFEGGTYSSPVLLFKTDDDGYIKFVVAALNCLSEITEQMANKIMAGDFDFKNNCYVCGHSWEKRSEVEKFGYCPK